MNPEIKINWLKALRSGQFKQGKKQLKVDTVRGSNYCCLGVLCEIQKVEQIKYGTNVYFIFNNYQAKEFPLSSFLHQCEIPFQTASCLADMNDRDHTFESIADYIEKHL